MDPLTIGATIAVLAAKTAGEKALEKLGEETVDGGWGLASRLVNKAKEKLGLVDDELAAELDQAAPSEADQANLAKRIDQSLEAAPKIKAELQPLAEAAQADPLLAPVLTNSHLAAHIGDRIDLTTSGDGNVVVGKAGGDATVTTNANPVPNPKS